MTLKIRVVSDDDLLICVSLDDIPLLIWVVLGDDLLILVALDDGFLILVVLLDDSVLIPVVLVDDIFRLFIVRQEVGGLLKERLERLPLLGSGRAFGDLGNRIRTSSSSAK